MKKRTLKKKIKDLFQFCIFYYVLSGVFLYPIFVPSGIWYWAVYLQTIALLACGLSLFCIWVLLNILSRIETKEKIEFIIRSPIAYRRLPIVKK